MKDFNQTGKNEERSKAQKAAQKIRRNAAAGREREISASGSKSLATASSKVLAGLLAVFLVAGSLGIYGSADAASEFSGKSPYTSSGYSTYYHNGRYSGNLIVNGVDLSAWQSSKCDFAKAKAAGVDYAILRVTYTNTSRFKSFRTNLDDNFATLYKNAKANGIMVGVYVFSQAKNTNEAIAEAKYAVNRLKALGIQPKDLELPVYMDYEFSAGVAGRLYGLKKTAATNSASAFCNTIKSYGYTPGIYANTTFFKNQLDTSKFASDVDLWCAQYYKRCESGVRYSKWQYSSSSKVDGLLFYTGRKGNIDSNFWYVNKKVAQKPMTTIAGKTTLSLADAKSPNFTIKNGKTTLKKGTDYIVGGIRNNRKGSAYVYIKGIGNYGGFAVVPIQVADKTSGKASTALNSKCANYLTYKNTANSTYIGTSQAAVNMASNTASKYKKNGVYTVQTELNVRKGAGTGYAKVKRSKLSKAARKVTVSGISTAVLKRGTKVKVKQVKGNWIKVNVKTGGKWKSAKGWICCKAAGEIYVK